MTPDHADKMEITVVFQCPPLAGENLTDRVYQNHLSRLKYLDTNPLTGRRGVSHMGRNGCLKLMVPIVL